MPEASQIAIAQIITEDDNEVRSLGAIGSVCMHRHDGKAYGNVKCH
jgi:hypothetical protein